MVDVQYGPDDEEDSLTAFDNDSEVYFDDADVGLSVDQDALDNDITEYDSVDDFIEHWDGE